MLRQPLENERVTISRVHSTVTYPSSLIMIGAMNPCPCGYFGSHQRYCSCSLKQIQAYRNRVSGPVLDRMDLLLTLTPVNLDKEEKSIETSTDIVARVKVARCKQHERYQREVSNAKVPYELLQRTSPLTRAQQKMLTQLATKQQWSNRVQLKVIRIVRTISDLAGSDHITDESIWEAMTLRREGSKDNSSVSSSAK
ncbi:ATP-binding protein [Bacillus sp. FJAT-45037]|uniref:ATP-binding protein n=1 Tax=Bacillus sp. FJAT-45037 TaxID=2011007 RepID=UPI000C2514FE|nr:ATP-binding protein [Bacillus sp. FJAT-45037]